MLQGRHDEVAAGRGVSNSSSSQTEATHGGRSVSSLRCARPSAVQFQIPGLRPPPGVVWLIVDDPGIVKKGVGMLFLAF